MLRYEFNYKNEEGRERRRLPQRLVVTNGREWRVRVRGSKYKTWKKPSADAQLSVSATTGAKPLDVIE